MLDIVPKYHCIQFQGKLINQTCENGKKPSFGHDFGPFGPKFDPQKNFLWFLPLLDIIYCYKLSLYVMSRKTNEQNLRKAKMPKKPSFWPYFGPKWGRQIFFFFKNLTSLVTRYHGQLSSCAISEKTNPILTKLSAGRTDRRTTVIS